MPGEIMDFSKLLKVVSGVSNGDVDAPARQRRLDSFIPQSGRNSTADGELREEKYIGFGRCRIKVPKWVEKIKFPNTIDPQSKLYLGWLFIVTSAFLYNVWVITLRATFNIYQTDSSLKYWWLFDYLCDFIYILDIILFKARLRFLRSGLLENDRKETMKHYMKKKDFKMDLLCLLPFDILYIIPAINYNPLVRIPRMLKKMTFSEFFDRMDQAASSGHIVRIVKTMTYMSFLIHLETCGYYAMSRYQGINSDRWVYDGKGIAYIRCLYLATKTATSIGKNPSPTNEKQWIFMTVYWLSGVFVFALLIGQIRDIFQSAGAIKNSYRKTLDQTIWYMESLNLPKELQDRVRLWLTYNWEQQKTLNENSLLDGLPKKMRTDLAINVHYHTLSKVQLFQDCDKNLLFDLVLKLKPVLYLPMDTICRKGEVGTEMYIVMAGQVEVVGGPDNNTVLATLSQGSVFGEISLLALAGGNRRTADVRSKGFSNLFILSKWDFEEAMRDYPEAQSLLKKRAKKLLAQNAKQVARQSKVEAEEVIKSRQGTPKLLKTVIQVVEPQSHIPEYLGINKLRKHTKNEGKNSKSAPKSANIPNRNEQSSNPNSEDVHSLQDDDNLFDDEEDEILIIEQTEHPIEPTKSVPETQNQTETKRGSKDSTYSNSDLADILGSQGDLTNIKEKKDPAPVSKPTVSNKNDSAPHKNANGKKSDSTLANKTIVMSKGVSVPANNQASANKVDLAAVRSQAPVSNGVSAIVRKKQSAANNSTVMRKAESNPALTKPTESNSVHPRGSGSQSVPVGKMVSTPTKNPSSTDKKQPVSGSKADVSGQSETTSNGKSESVTSSKPGSANSSAGKKSKSPSPTTLKLVNNKVAPELESVSMNESRSSTPKSEDLEKALSCPPELIGKAPTPPISATKKSTDSAPAPGLVLEKTQTAPISTASKPQSHSAAQLKKMPTTPNLIDKKPSQPNVAQIKKASSMPQNAPSKKNIITPSIQTRKTALPSGVQMKKLDLQIPPENKVTADVVVHREKNSTPTVNETNKKKGVDNLGFEAISNGQAQSKKDVKETEL